MKLIIFLSTLLCTITTYAQICLGDDVSVCAGSSLTIQNCGGLNPGNGGPQTIQLDNPTVINLSDDAWSAAIPIPFNFNFYGTAFNNVVIGSNGIISFDVAQAGTNCAWNIQNVGQLPNPTFTDAHNTVMVAYQDINPGLGGTIQYQTIGTAPNRKFVVLYQDMPYFSGQCAGLCNYMSCVLNEGTDVVEIHIGNKPNCTAWNGGLSITGIQNSDGSIAHTVPGMNNTVYAVNQQAFEFVPTSPTNYVINNIPYTFFTSPNSSYEWADTEGNTYDYNNGVLNLQNIQVNIDNPIGFFVTGSSCGAGVGAVSDTTWITILSSSVGLTMTPDLCSANIGTVSATPISGTAPFTFNWTTFGNATTPTITGVGEGVQTVVMTDDNGCSSSASIMVTDTPASYSGSSTLVSCKDGDDGTATAVMTPEMGVVTYQWDDPNAQTTPTATGLTAGIYTCVITSDIGCSGTVTIDVTEIPSLQALIASQTDVTCNSAQDGTAEITVTQGTLPYSYSWGWSGPGSNLADNLGYGDHLVTVTDALGCTIEVPIFIDQPDPLVISTLTPDTQICPEHDILLQVAGIGGSSDYTFTWSQNGNVIGTGSEILVDPELTNTEYCVTLTEECGSPQADSCLMINFPTPIAPQLTPNHTDRCLPGIIAFENTSSNLNEIASSIFEMGNIDVVQTNGSEGFVYEYPKPGEYTVTISTTSIYGCLYTDTVENFITIHPDPIANFHFSTNPTTQFETEIKMVDVSSSNVVNWQWFSPGSTPSSSTNQEPSFIYPQEVAQHEVTLIVESDLGCIDTITKILYVNSDILFYTPNTFTPNGDEFNQTWKNAVMGIDVTSFNIKIFNRWGELIWEGNDLEVGWDGTYKGRVVPDGIYSWKAEVKDENSDEKREFAGHVNVMR